MSCFERLSNKCISPAPTNVFLNRLVGYWLNHWKKEKSIGRITIVPVHLIKNVPFKHQCTAFQAKILQAVQDLAVLAFSKTKTIKHQSIRISGEKGRKTRTKMPKRMLLLINKYDAKHLNDCSSFLTGAPLFGVMHKCPPLLCLIFIDHWLTRSEAHFKPWRCNQSVYANSLTHPPPYAALILDYVELNRVTICLPTYSTLYFPPPLWMLLFMYTLDMKSA